MGGVAALVALGATLVAGLFFIAAGGALAALILQRFPRPNASPLPFRPLWKVTSLTFFLGLVLGNVLHWLGGGPSPVVTLIGLPLYLALFSWLLRRRFPQSYGCRPWWMSALQSLLATLGSCLILFMLLTAISAMLG